MRVAELWGSCFLFGILVLCLLVSKSCIHVVDSYPVCLFTWTKKTYIVIFQHRLGAAVKTCGK